MKEMGVAEHNHRMADRSEYFENVDENGEKFPYLQNIISKPDAAPNKGEPEGKIWNKTELRPGIWLNVIDAKPEKPVIIRYEKKRPLIDFGFVLTGDIWNRVQNISTSGMELNNSTGLGGVLYLPKSEGIVEIPGKKRIQILHVHVDPQVLYSLLRDDMGMVPSDFRAVMEGGVHQNYVCRGKMVPEVQTVAHQILHTPSHGIPRRLFLESKALELISLQLTWLASLGGRQNKQSGLSPAERERIHAARELLVRDMASPPPLSELSQRLCLSINKLEAGFQELFGMTVFGYLREYKMQKARHFFEEAEMNVSQVAWAVGYVNVSHFSAAYKKRFGILPKAYLRTARRKIIPA